MSKLNDLARDVPHMIENAATASQNASLIDDDVTREAITLNVAAPLIAELSEAEAKLARALEGLRAAKELADLAAHLTGCRADDEYVWGFQEKFDALLSELENK